MSNDIALCLRCGRSEREGNHRDYFKKGYHRFIFSGVFRVLDDSQKATSTNQGTGT